MKKRFIKSIASVLSTVMLCSFIAPTTALAQGWRRPPRRHHHSEAWLVVPALIGVGVAINNHSKKSNIRTVERTEIVEDVAPNSYEAYKDKFINSLDNAELELYYYLDSLEPSKKGKNYKRHCSKSVTQRRLKKIITALHEEYTLIRVQGDYVYFRKL